MKNQYANLNHQIMLDVFRSPSCPFSRPGAGSRTISCSVNPADGAVAYISKATEREVGDIYGFYDPPSGDVWVEQGSYLDGFMLALGWQYRCDAHYLRFGVYEDRDSEFRAQPGVWSWQPRFIRRVKSPEGEPLVIEARLCASDDFENSPTGHEFQFYVLDDDFQDTGKLADLTLTLPRTFVAFTPIGVHYHEALHYVREKGLDVIKEFEGDEYFDWTSQMVKNLHNQLPRLTDYLALHDNMEARWAVIEKLLENPHELASVRFNLLKTDDDRKLYEAVRNSGLSDCFHAHSGELFGERRLYQLLAERKRAPFEYLSKSLSLRNACYTLQNGVLFETSDVALKLAGPAAWSPVVSAPTDAYREMIEKVFDLSVPVIDDFNFSSVITLKEQLGYTFQTLDDDGWVEAFIKDDSLAPAQKPKAGPSM